MTGGVDPKVVQRQNECLGKAADLWKLLSVLEPPSESTWRTIAALARQIERRAAEQYRAKEAA